MISDSYRRQILDAKRCVVALSGGLDSVVLLDVMAGLKPRELKALHVDHQLFSASGEVSDFCREVCLSYSVDFTAVQVNVVGTGSLEGRAREARYAAFEAYLEPGDLLLQAHHADDQIETILLSLFRGSRAPGLRGMPATRAVGAAELLRPLLDVHRADIERYARNKSLTWREDPTNSDLSIDRNYIRHHVLPGVYDRFPKAGSNMLRGLARDAKVEKRLAAADHQNLLKVQLEPDCLDLLALRGLVTVEDEPGDALSPLLDYWLTLLGVPRVSGRCLTELSQRIVTGSDIDIKAGQLMFRQHDSKLYVLQVLPDHVLTEQPLGTADVPLAGGLLTNQKEKANGLRMGPDYQIRFRRGGERIRLGQHKSLKNVFQEHQVPVWLRDRLPLIYVDEALVAIAGLRDWGVSMLVADDWRASDESDGLQWVASFEDRSFRDR